MGGLQVFKNKLDKFSLIPIKIYYKLKQHNSTFNIHQKILDYLFVCTYIFKIEIYSIKIQYKAMKFVMKAINTMGLKSNFRKNSIKTNF